MLVISGLSGQCVGFYTAVVLKVPLLVVRKEPTKTGTYGVKRTLMATPEISDFWRAYHKPPRICFLDDWIGSGGTRKETCEIIHAKGGNCTVEYLYGREQDGFFDIDPEIYKQFGPVKKLRELVL